MSRKTRFTDELRKFYSQYKSQRRALIAYPCREWRALIAITFNETLEALFGKILNDCLKGSNTKKSAFQLNRKENKYKVNKLTYFN